MSTAVESTPAPVKPDQAMWLTNYITVNDIQGYITFLEKALGLTLGNAMCDDQGVPMHAEFLHKGTVVLMACPEGAFGNPLKAPATTGQPMPANFYLYVDDIDATFEAAQAAGAKVQEAPKDQFWGDRTAMITDPAGYGWMIATHTGKEFAPDAAHS